MSRPSGYALLMELRRRRLAETPDQAPCSGSLEPTVRDPLSQAEQLRREVGRNAYREQGEATAARCSACGAVVFLQVYRHGYGTVSLDLPGILDRSARWTRNGGQEVAPLHLAAAHRPPFHVEALLAAHRQWWERPQ